MSDYSRISKQNTNDAFEAGWKAFTNSDEYYKFRLVIHALRQLPPVSKIAEARADFEFFLHGKQYG